MQTDFDVKNMHESLKFGLFEEEAFSDRGDKLK